VYWKELLKCWVELRPKVLLLLAALQSDPQQQGKQGWIQETRSERWQQGLGRQDLDLREVEKELP
jgi:hypothetical protein